MIEYIPPNEISFLVLTPSHERNQRIFAATKTPAVFLMAGTRSTDRAFFFRDLQKGTVLCIRSNNTFSLQDSAGYDSGTILAQQMHFEAHDISVWHQDERFSFTCQANPVTGFFFGWFIDRRYGKSCRILDPGKTV